MEKRLADESASAVGYCHALTFEGGAPSWDDIIRFVHDQGDRPSNLVRHDVYKNRLNDRAVTSSAKLWVDQYVKTPKKIKLGTGAIPGGQTGPLATDEDCWTPDNTTVKSVDIKTTFLGIYSEYGVTYLQTEANSVSYTEALLTDEDGNAWAHAVVAFSKTSSQTGVLLWKIQHIGN